MTDRSRYSVFIDRADSAQSTASLEQAAAWQRKAYLTVSLEVPGVPGRRADRVISPHTMVAAACDTLVIGVIGRRRRGPWIPHRPPSTVKNGKIAHSAKSGTTASSAELD
jgi:hypothetical protein